MRIIENYGTIRHLMRKYFWKQVSNLICFSLFLIETESSTRLGKKERIKLYLMTLNWYLPSAEIYAGGGSYLCTETRAVCRKVRKHIDSLFTRGGDTLVITSTK